MITNVRTTVPAAMGMSVGEFDIIKGRLTVSFVRPEVKGGKAKIHMFEIPEGVKSVIYEDRDWGALFEGSLEHLKGLEKDDLFVYFDVEDKSLKRIR